MPPPHPKEAESSIPTHICLRAELLLPTKWRKLSLSNYNFFPPLGLEGEGSLEKGYPPKVGLFKD